MWNDHINKLVNRPTYFRLSAAMLGFRLPVISDNIVTLFFGMLDPDNVGIGVGIRCYPTCRLSYGGGNFYLPRLAGTVVKFR